jgi:UDP-N-acetylglucosamine 4-epimerase
MESRLIQNSRVLVTGGAGFIGSNLCETLLNQNNYVVCLDDFSTGHRHNLTEFSGHRNFQLIEGDIRNYKDCKKAVAGMEYVLHHAALGSVPRSIKNPVLTNEVNVGGFVNMMFAAKEEGVKRFVYASSSAVYGDSPELPKVEHQIGKPLSPYAITKLVNEVYARNFSELYGLETIGLRYFNVFGRRQDPMGDYAAVIPKFIQKLNRRESPQINGNGCHSRDFTYIDNVIQVVQLAAILSTETIRKRRSLYMKRRNGLESRTSDDSVLSEVFNVAHGERTDLNKLVEILNKNLSLWDDRISEVPVLYGPNRLGDIAHSLADITKAREVLGYEPEMKVHLGLEKTCHWYCYGAQKD